MAKLKVALELSYQIHLSNVQFSGKNSPEPTYGRRCVFSLSLTFHLIF